MNEAYAVAIVLDPNFGVRLREVAARFDLWTVTSQINRTVVEQLWKEAAETNEFQDVSIWTSELTGPTVAEWRAILENIEDHHGPHGHDPPVTILEVYGAPFTNELRRELGHYGYDTFEPTSDGFRAIRLLPTNF